MNNKSLKSFKDIIVWQKAANLATLLYEITEKFPRSELYGLTNQMRRAAVSISSNIAEGFKRSHQKEKSQFYNISYGSVAELESQVEISLKLVFLSKEDYQKISALIIEVSKLLDSLIKSLWNNRIKANITSIMLAVFFLYSIFYLLNPQTVFAAEFSFSQPRYEVKKGELFEISLLLNTEKENINALEGKINFPDDILNLKQIKDSNSIINFWVEKPLLVNNKIIFSDIVPGGYKTEKGMILSFVFEAKNEGSGNINILDASALLNDGEGNKVRLKLKKSAIKILASDLETESESSKNLGESLDYEYDKNPPENFTPIISQDTNIFDGKYFVAFKTEDKQSGIDRYELKETKSKKQEIDDWSMAESPYVLNDQSLKSYIHIKAIDRAGNARTVSISPQHPSFLYENYLFWFIITIILLATYFLYRKSSSFLNHKQR